MGVMGFNLAAVIEGLKNCKSGSSGVDNEESDLSRSFNLSRSAQSVPNRAALRCESAHHLSAASQQQYRQPSRCTGITRHQATPTASQQWLRCDGLATARYSRKSSEPSVTGNRYCRAALTNPKQ